MQKDILRLFWQTAMKYPVRTLFSLSGAAVTNVIGSFAGPYIISLILEKLQSGTVTLESVARLAYVTSQPRRTRGNPALGCPRLRVFHFVRWAPRKIERAQDEPTA